MGSLPMASLLLLLLFAAPADAKPPAALQVDLECTPEIEFQSEMMARCCAAQRAWLEAEALGGCGAGSQDPSLGVGTHRRDVCREAEVLCKDCTELKHAALAPPTNLTMGRVVAAPSARMYCVPANPNAACAAIADISIAIVFLTGVVLLVLTGAWVVFFDVRGLPWLLRRLERSWCGAGAAPPQPPPRPPLRVAGPSGAPPPGLLPKVRGSPPPKASEGLRFAAGGDAHAAAVGFDGTGDWPPSAASLVSEEDCGKSRPVSCGTIGTQSTMATSASLSAGGGSEPGTRGQTPRSGLGDACVVGAAMALEDCFPEAPALGEARSTLPSPPLALEAGALWSRPATPRRSRPGTPASRAGSTCAASTGFGGYGGSRRHSVGGSAGVQQWPPRLARLWASRSVFNGVSSVAVFARLCHTIACASTSTQKGISVSQSAADAAELMAIILPFAWCSWFSRPPSRPSAVISDSLAHGLPCRRVPRFLVFAALTALVEISSTMKAAHAVTASGCDAPPYQTISLHCFGIVVAVLRCYSALLALRLQDDFNGACRRVLPLDVAVAGAAALAPGDILCDVKVDGDSDREDVNPEDVLPASLLRPRSPSGGLKQGRGDGEPRAGEEDTVALAGEKASGARALCCCKRALPERIQKRLSSRLLLRLGLVLAILLATVSVWVFHYGKEAPAKEPLPSSCATAQNSTSTCSHFESVDFYDHTKGDSLAGMADTEEDCCAGCDQVAGCQGWMFERASRRCRWIRFLEAPCKEDPGDLSCRCLTHQGSTFGFKPISQIVWLHRRDV
eukprot:TRINITY_DN17476_c0_g6_i1.p1 TRINITY_DN17476_c0_g6~~TRINITY_DN17476_c0_g6_i1.p1  ORF type:complete len:823 (-),score=176.11 TRINITY_DN17476_c0_g6_i1:135-2507(-)